MALASYFFIVSRFVMTDQHCTGHVRLLRLSREVFRIEPNMSKEFAHVVMAIPLRNDVIILSKAASLRASMTCTCFLTISNQDIGTGGPSKVKCNGLLVFVLNISCIARGFMVMLSNGSVKSLSRRCRWVCDFVDGLSFFYCTTTETSGAKRF